MLKVKLESNCLKTFSTCSRVLIFFIFTEKFCGKHGRIFDSMLPTPGIEIKYYIWLCVALWCWTMSRFTGISVFSPDINIYWSVVAILCKQIAIQSFFISKREAVCWWLLFPLFSFLKGKFPLCHWNFNLSPMCHQKLSHPLNATENLTLPLMCHYCYSRVMWLWLLTEGKNDNITHS